MAIPRKIPCLQFLVTVSAVIFSSPESLATCPASPDTSPATAAAGVRLQDSVPPPPAIRQSRYPAPKAFPGSSPLAVSLPFLDRALSVHRACRSPSDTPLPRAPLHSLRCSSRRLNVRNRVEREKSSKPCQ